MWRATWPGGMGGGRAGGAAGVGDGEQPRREGITAAAAELPERVVVVTVHHEGEPQGDGEQQQSSAAGVVRSPAGTCFWPEAFWLAGRERSTSR